MNKCNGCIAYEPQPGAANIGQCRMLPPTVQLVMIPGQRTPSNPNGQAQLTAQGFFPPVRGDVDYCRSWVPALTQ